MESHIVHCDLDTFFVSVERLERPELVGKPVLVGGSSGRGVVASCSYEARRFGVHSAMPMKQALRLCPEAIIVRGDHDKYSRYSRMVTDILSEAAPVVEKASIDEHYLDVSGMDRYFGCWKWTRELRQRIIKESGLPISFGLSSGKVVSKIATGMAKPSGELYVLPGEEKAFLAPLPVRKIPGVGEKLMQRLDRVGIQKIESLQKADPAALERLLGGQGLSLWKKANGMDDSPVVPHGDRKSMSKECTFPEDIADAAMLREYIKMMVDELSFSLRKEGRLCACVSLKLRYADFETTTRQVRIPYSCSDRVLTEKALELLRQAYQPGTPIRLIGIRLSELVSGSYQIDLFNDVLTDINLSRAMDGIRNKFGVELVKRGEPSMMPRRASA